MGIRSKRANEHWLLAGQKACGVSSVSCLMAWFSTPAPTLGLGMLLNAADIVPKKEYN